MQNRLSIRHETLYLVQEICSRYMRWGEIEKEKKILNDMTAKTNSLFFIRLKKYKTDD